MPEPKGSFGPDGGPRVAVYEYALAVTGSAAPRRPVPIPLRIADDPRELALSALMNFGTGRAAEGINLNRMSPADAAEYLAQLPTRRICLPAQERLTRRAIAIWPLLKSEPRNQVRTRLPAGGR
jgi:hypothetical protein